jgi:hypothetical protein
MIFPYFHPGLTGGGSSVQGWTSTYSSITFNAENFVCPAIAGGSIADTTRVVWLAVKY